MSGTWQAGEQLTLPGMPEEAVGAVILTVEPDETVGAYLTSRRETVLPPRRTVARALLELAMHLERVADEAGDR